MDSIVRYVRVMPTCQLGPRSQLELEGAPVRYTNKGLAAWPGVPETAWGGPREIFPYALFVLGGVQMHR